MALDPALLICTLAAAFCAAVAIAVVLLVLRADRGPAPDAMAEAHGDLPMMPQQSIQGSLERLLP